MIIGGIEITIITMAVLMAVAAVGAKDQKTGERCVVLSAIFTAALVALLVAIG